MKNKSLKKKVFVAMSGGVDSSVSAALLKKSGYDVVGVFIKVWAPDFIEPARLATRSVAGGCPWRAERRDAMRVAARLGIPFLTFDLEKEYKREVVDYMINEYRAGRTPNPDVMCNRAIKFGAFFRKARALGADYIATGHYARISPPPPFGTPSLIKEGVGGDNLLRGADRAKDQSYFLWGLSQAQLKHCLFPVGHLRKKEVRALARKFGLLNAEKKDSQGLCFLGKVDVKDFLKHYIKEKPGKVLLAPSGIEGDEDGKVIGRHRGVFFFTLGERHGFEIFQKSSREKPYYVVGKNIRKNLLIVSSDPFQRHSNILKNVRISSVNWIMGQSPKVGKKLVCQMRYHGPRLPCRLARQDLVKRIATVELFKPVLAAPSQSLVLYDRETCLGGGIIMDFI